MQASFLRQNIFPTLAAFIWGTAFVAQSVAAEFVPAFTFNAARAVVAFVFLLILCLILRCYRAKRAIPQGRGAAYWRRLIVGGVCCGTALMIAANLQQKGIETTTTGKAGFITALYIVIVPLLGLLLHKKVGRMVWLSVALAVAGLYFLCLNEDLTIGGGDILILLCAFCFAVQIMIVDHFAPLVDGIELSCVQFLVVTVLSALGMLLTEQPAWEVIEPAIGSILYVGIFSSGVAYTLQILAQKGSNPTTVSLLLSLEAVFATLGGAIILHEQMSLREYGGCLLMLAAVVLAQLPELKPKPRWATVKK